MRKLVSGLIVSCLFAGGVAHAQLADTGNGLINHPAANMTWEADGNLFKTMAAANPNLVDDIITTWGSLPLPFDHTLHAVAVNSTPADFYPAQGTMTYWGAIAWIHYLNVTHHKGYSDWRLANIGGPVAPGACGGACYPGNVNSSEWWRLFGQELGGTFGTSIHTSHNASYNLFTAITGGFSDNVAGDLVNMFFADGGQGRNYIAIDSVAWPVRTGQSSSNPQPMGYPVASVLKLAFPDTVTWATSAPKTFTLINRGDGPLTISALTTTVTYSDGAISLAQDEFSATHDCPTPLPAAASCTVSVTFKPRNFGTYLGTLDVVSNGKPRRIDLEGKGILGVDLTASATTRTVGQTVTLDWAASSNDIVGCDTTGGTAGDGWTGTGGQFGSRTVTSNTAGAVTYTVTCAKGVEVSDSVTVTYTLPTATLAAASTNIQQGAANTLTWTSANADACTATSNGSGAWTGTKATNGNASVNETALGMITYTITCTSAGQSGAASVNVFVNAPPSSSSSSGGGGGGGGGSFELLTLLALISALWPRWRKLQPALQ
jgi:hypothetical protein